MRQLRAQVIIGVQALIAILGMASYCFAEPDRPFRVGVIQSLSGLAAEDGKTVVQALTFAAEKIRSAPGSSGIELLIEDDQTIPRNAVSAWQKLHSQQVDAVIGATWDFTTNPLLPLAARDQRVLFATSTLPESLDLKNAGEYGFINAISALSEAQPFAQFLDVYTPASLSLVYANNSWGESQRQVYRAVALQKGIRLVDEVKPATYDANEWAQIVPRLKASSPELVLLLLNRSDIRVFLKRALEIGFAARFFASKNAYDTFRLEEGKSFLEGLCFTYPLKRMQGQSEFFADYQKRFGEAPRIYADTSWDALFILHRAYLKSKRENVKLADALRSVSYDGLAGRYTYDPQRSFSTGGSSLVCVRHGQVSLLP